MVDFRIDVVVNPSGAQRGARQAERSLNRLKNSADRTRQSFSQIFAAIGGALLARQAITTIATFEQSIAELGAVSGATAGELEALSQTAQELGRTTRFTASQAAEGLTLLARAGFSVAEQTQAIPGTLRLAQAAGIQLAQAADITASALRGFRLEAAETARVTDVLTLTSTKANTTISQLSEGLKFVAPVAAGLNVSLEQTSAALGVLSDAGLQATLAGTGFRRVLAELEAPTAASRKILAQLGVEADEVRVSQVGLTAALERLKDAGLDTGLALRLFGQRGGPAFEVLSSNIPKVKELTEELKDADGTTKNFADTVDDTLIGASKRAVSAFQGFLLQLDSGFKIAENLKTSLDGLAGAINIVSEALGSGLSAAEAEAALLLTGQRIQAIRRELALLNRQIANQDGFASEGQQARIAELNRRLQLLTGNVRKQAEATKKAKEEEDKAAAARELNAAKAERNAQKTVDPIEKRIQALRDENEVLRVQAVLGDNAARVKELEIELRNANVTILPKEREELAKLVEEQAALNKVIEDREKLGADGTPVNTDQDRVRGQVDSILQGVGATEQFALQQEELNQRFRDGKIDVETYQAATDQLTINALAGSRKLEDGFTRAFAKIRQEARDFAKVAEGIVNAFADRATEAIVGFVETGKFSFKDFANALLKDIARIIVRLLVVQAIEAATRSLGGGAGGAAGQVAGAAVNIGASAATSSGRQKGGTVQPGSSFVVGENGPELFRPQQTGSIVPNEKDQPQVKPEVNVSVVNVRSEDEARAEIDSGDLDAPIVNLIGRNATKIQQALSNRT